MQSTKNVQLGIKDCERFELNKINGHKKEVYTIPVILQTQYV